MFVVRAGALKPAQPFEPGDFHTTTAFAAAPAYQPEVYSGSSGFSQEPTYFQRISADSGSVLPCAPDRSAAGTSAHGGAPIFRLVVGERGVDDTAHARGRCSPNLHQT